jgi:hypothetical protein
MTRTKITFLVAAGIPVTLMMQGANAASLKPAGALGQGDVGSIMQKTHGCHQNCKPGPWFYQGTRFFDNHRHRLNDCRPTLVDCPRK